MNEHLAFPEEWSRLLSAMADDTLAAEDEQQLARLLRNDPEFRQEYVRFCQMVAQLTWHSDAGPTVRDPAKEKSPASTSMTGWRRTGPARTIVAVATTAVVAVAGLWLGLWQAGDDSLGTVVNVAGQVGVTHGDDAPVWLTGKDLARPARRLRSGDRLDTGGSGSASIVLSDLTEIQVHAGTQLTVTSGQGITVRMPAGRIRARVSPQRPGQALTFVTSQSEVRVLGTELELLAASTHTEVAVEEGRVRVTRPADGRSVEVAASQFVSASGSGGLTVMDVPRPPVEWSADFERGLPAGWTGRLVRDALPEGSDGAVGAAPVMHPNGMSREAVSPTVEDGLFEWHADSVLHVTFRVQPPEWFHIYLFARHYSGPGSSLTYCCVKPDLWQRSPGQWRTVSIPLSEFHSVTPGREELALGRVPMRIAFSGQGGSSGVLIDRVWVDRLPPSLDPPK